MWVITTLVFGVSPLEQFVCFYCGKHLAFAMTCSVFAAYGLCHQDPDCVPDPWPSQGPARQNAQREIPDPGNDVWGRAGEAAEGEKREEEEGQEPSQGMALNWYSQRFINSLDNIHSVHDSCGVWFIMLRQTLCPALYYWPQLLLTKIFAKHVN